MPFRISAPGAGYALAMGILLVVGGRLGDRYGQRRMFLIGIAGLTVASLWCGLSAGPAMLIAGRLVQGGFGALLIPQGIGILISADIAGLTWRPIFLINIVLGDLAPHLPADHRRHELHAPGGVEVEAEADIQADPAVTLLVKGQRLSGTARIIPPPDPGYGRL